MSSAYPLEMAACCRPPRILLGKLLQRVRAAQRCSVLPLQQTRQCCAAAASSAAGQNGGGPAGAAAAAAAAAQADPATFDGDDPQVSLPRKLGTEAAGASSTGAFQRLPMVAPSKELLDSAVRRAARVPYNKKLKNEAQKAKNRRAMLGLSMQCMWQCPQQG